MKKFLAGILLLLLSMSISAQLKMPEVFTDNAVLQCGTNVNVWGKANPNASVTVKFANQKVCTKTDSTGYWQLSLVPMPASAKPSTMTIKSGKEKIELKNLLVGEVWLAGGQSNMEYNMGPTWPDGYPKTVQPKHTNNIQQETLERIAACDKVKPGSAEPLIRLFRVHKELNTDTLPSMGWQQVDCNTINDFSACAYFFAKNLSDSLNIPVGIIASNWGGTKIEDWNGDNGIRYRKMMRPMAPYSLQGFIWYQGETNLTMGQTKEYYDLMCEMISNWRLAFGNGREMPFYFVQLAPYLYSDRRYERCAITWDALPRFQRWQDKVAADMPNVDRIIISDLVDEGELADIHPTFKWEVGRRLTNMALNETYGRKDIIAKSPEVKSWSLNGDKEIVVEFECFGSNLTTCDGKEPAYFEVMDSRSSRWIKADAYIEGNNVILKAPDGRSINNFRHSWDESYQTNLCNTQLLPTNVYNSYLKDY